MAAGKRTRPAHLMLAQQLGVAIVTGRHPPGTVLPGEIERAETLGVSRSVVGEMLRTLAAKRTARHLSTMGHALETMFTHGLANEIGRTTAEDASVV
ncbi:GntR family transcriptional regulator [Sphingomonas mollis]|uniref:FadR family transcriptional regulator n=1 Tax=Sphingomonas mollis TaxID=2795726 RepID=A0ABS0XU15_9SPHN|nr:GntR family transcriptional regulator [Sphingomonas sp. BT553]MBJ6123535.1 FadR family transcriptional regulator [Sphingomonas sp. BT553]